MTLSMLDPDSFNDGEDAIGTKIRAEILNILSNYSNMITPATANLAMGSFKITGLAAATAAGDAVRYEQLGWTLIESKSASASATVEFTSGLSTTYNQYVVTFTDIVPTTDTSTFQLRVSQSGVFNSGAGSYQWVRVGGSAGDVSPGIASDASDSEIELAANLGNAAGEGLCGELRFWNPAGTSRFKLFSWQVAYLSAAGGIVVSTGTASPSGIGGTGAIDGLQFFMSGGNTTSGTFALYGVRKT